MGKSIENTASVKGIEGYVKTFILLMLAVFCYLFFVVGLPAESLSDNLWK